MHHFRIARTLGFSTLLLHAAAATSEDHQASAAPVVFERRNRTIVYHGADGSIVLSAYTPMVRANDGAVIVLDRRGGGVYRINQDRGPTRIGRHGSGPGEFKEPVALGWLADTLWVSDKQTMRVTFLPNEGSGRPRTTTFASMTGTVVPHTVPYGVTPFGTVIVASISPASEVVEQSAALPVLLLDRAGVRVHDTLAMLRVQNGELIAPVRGSRAIYTVAQPFSDASLWSVSSDGRWFVQLDRFEPLALNQQRSATVSMQSTDGRQRYQRALPGPRERLADAEFSDVVERTRARLDSDGKRVGYGPVDVARLRAAMYRPTYKPRATEVLVATAGIVVFRGAETNVDQVPYTLLNAEGREIGTFDVGRRQRVRLIHGMQIWSVDEDRDGELYIIREDLVARAGRGR
jgi:hypothetical protein